MNIKDMNEFLKKNQIPEDKKDQESWFKMQKEIEFLNKTQEGMIPLYISSDEFFLYSSVISKEKLKNINQENCETWNSLLLSSESYFLDKINSEKEKKDFWEETTPLLFFNNLNETGYSYIEINQEIKSIIDFHWIDDENSYCKVNEHGDFYKVVTIDDTENNFHLCTMNSEDLDIYLNLTNSVLLRFFDIQHVTEKFEGWTGEENIITIQNEKNHIFGNMHEYFNSNGKIDKSCLRGIQICDKKKPKNNTKPKKYADFIIWDFKNSKLIEESVNPKNFVNYYPQKSDLPYAVSPVFFRSEVLNRFKFDKEKYKFGTDFIKCRNMWTLKFGINDENQIYLYVRYLSRMPYNEQLYWKSFNEAPRTGISKRTIDTDFKGIWPEPNPLESLKNALREFPKIKINEKEYQLINVSKLYKLHDLTALDYILTDNESEWEEQIRNLETIIVEGIKPKTIKKITGKEKLKGINGSINQLEKCLQELEVDSDEINLIISPLKKIVFYRKPAAHRGLDYNRPKNNLRENFESLISETNCSIHKLTELINEGIFNKP